MVNLTKLSLKSDLSYWLTKYNIRPNKRLGQCFLVSEKALDKIVSAAAVRRGDKILEIGPGTGILTEKLLAKGGTVLAVEKDSRLINILSARFSKEIKNKQFILIQADFLKLKFPGCLKKHNFASGKYRVIANLPYQITSPTIERLLERNFLPSSTVFTIQKEVAERICAKPGNLSSLAVLVQACTQKCTYVAKFPRAYFYPMPEVNSALIKLEGIAYPGGIEIKKLRQVIRAGFAQKRKKLKKNLQNVFPADAIEKIWSDLKISENTRAQEFPVDKWIEIAKIFT
ncbi:MAG: 16S rRNA (adenine(1518)-N(6)/adenine(1519)-N(6))-dimethyltransferase RsmA [Candidatus Moraniibacteriota bacterium]